MNAEYTRVIPRDLFNESKLLKCIGRLTLLIHDGFAINGMTFEHDGDPFSVALMDDGFLCITNIIFEMNDENMLFKCQYNSKSNYSLFLEYDYCDYLVFDESGDYTKEFKDICNDIYNNIISQ